MACYYSTDWRFRKQFVGCYTPAMHMYRLAGTYRAIGAEYGMLLRANRIMPPPLSQTRRKFTEACEPHVRAHAPELLEEIAGLAEGSGYDLERLKAAALIMNARPACSIVAVSGQHTADGKPLYGRNHDGYYSTLSLVAFCETRPQGALPSLGCHDMFVGRMDGINAAGVAIGVTAVEGGRDHPGVMFHIAMRIVLDRCRSTAEAVEFLQQIRHARTANLMVADSGGDIAIVEIAPGRVHVIRPANGFAAVTNQFLSDEMARYEKVRGGPPTSYRRWCTLREWFAARQVPITAAAVQGILSTPYPHGVCALPFVRRKGMFTVWSWTARLGANQIELAAGSPVETPYRAYELSERPFEKSDWAAFVPHPPAPSPTAWARGSPSPSPTWWERDLG
jgi:predicted choloylglycine hydrolase